MIRKFKYHLRFSGWSGQWDHHWPRQQGEDENTNKNNSNSSFSLLCFLCLTLQTWGIEFSLVEIFSSMFMCFYNRFTKQSFNSVWEDHDGSAAPRQDNRQGGHQPAQGVLAQVRHPVLTISRTPCTAHHVVYSLKYVITHQEHHQDYWGQEEGRRK